MELKEKLEVIKQAKILIDMGWCQTDYAVDKYGNSTSAWSKHACAWCSCGALRASMPRETYEHGVLGTGFLWSDYEEVREILDDYIEDNGLGVALVDYNEAWGRTQFDILHVFSQVIKQLEEEIDGTQGNA